MNHLPDCKLSFAPMSECGCLHKIATNLEEENKVQKKLIRELAKELRYFTNDNMDSLESIKTHKQNTKKVLKKIKDMGF